MQKYLYILCTVILTVYGQLVIKWRLNIRNLQFSEDFFTNFFIFLQFLLDPYVASGLAAAFLSSFFWIITVAKFELSQAYPIILGGLAIITTSSAILIFKESLTFYKLSGIFFVILGIYLINRV